MRDARLPLRQVIEAAAEASYEARRVKTGSKPWHERSADDRRRYQEAIAGAFEYLTTIGYAIKPASRDGGIPGMVTISIEDARALWTAFTRTDAPRAETLRAYSALQSALDAAEASTVPELVAG
jgi:hypothetical protein